jgi:hypothetical protein
VVERLPGMYTLGSIHSTVEGDGQLLCCAHKFLKLIKTDYHFYFYFFSVCYHIEFFLIMEKSKDLLFAGKKDETML